MILQIVGSSRRAPLDIPDGERLLAEVELPDLDPVNIIRLLQVINDRLQEPNDPVLDAGAVDLPELAQHHVDPLDGLLALQVLLLEEERVARGGHLRPGAVDPDLALGAAPPAEREELVEGGADEEEEREEAEHGAADGGQRRRGERVDHAELGPELGDQRVFSRADGGEGGGGA